MVPALQAGVEGVGAGCAPLLGGDAAASVPLEPEAVREELLQIRATCFLFESKKLYIIEFFGV